MIFRVDARGQTSRAALRRGGEQRIKKSRADSVTACIRSNPQPPKPGVRGIVFARQEPVEIAEQPAILLGNVKREHRAFGGRGCRHLARERRTEPLGVAVMEVVEVIVIADGADRK